MKISQFWRRIQAVALALIIGLVPLSGFSMARARPVTHAAQQTQVVTLNIDGIVQSINGDIWIVSGVTVHVTAQTLITGYPVVGSIVHIVAFTDSNNQITAQSIALIPGTPTPQLSPTPTLSATPGASPTPTLTTIPGTITPTVIPVLSPTPIPYVTIIIEGPVESININIIVVYGQRIKLRSGDPVLAKLKVGDWVKISGNRGFDDDGVTVVIIVVVIVIEDAPTTIVIVPPSGNDDGKKHKGDEGDD